MTSIRLADRRSLNFCHKKDRFNVSVRTAYCADDLTCACDSANIAEAYVRERSNAEINCNDEDAAVLMFPPGSRRRCGGMLSTLDNKDSQGTSYAITRDMQDALFHASPMFSPGVESEFHLAMTRIGSDRLPMEHLS